MNLKWSSLQKFLKFWIPFTGTTLALNLAFIMGPYFVSQTGDEKQIAALGVADSVVSVLLRPFTLTLAEVSGVLLATEFGAKNYLKMAKINKQTVGILLTIFCCYLAIVVFMEDILVAIGTSPELAKNSTNLIHLMIPGCLLESINMAQQSLIFSQNITDPFIFYSGFVFFQGFVLGRYCVSGLNFGAKGVALSRLCQEIVNFIFYQCMLCFLGEPSASKIFSGGSLFDGLDVYLRKLAYSTGLLYGDFIAYYYNMLLLMRTQNDVDISAWSTVLNIGILLLSLSMGFANSIRTIIGDKIGENRLRTAKKKAKIYIFYSLVFAGFLSVIFQIFPRAISSLFANNDQIIDRMVIGIHIGGFFMMGTITLMPTQTLFRLLNLDAYIMWGSGILNPCFMIVITSIMFVFLDWGLTGIFIGYPLGQTLITLVYLYKLFFNHKWGENITRPIDEESTRDILKN